ncbi:MAG: hypothetical protein GY730_08780 [bacterium]|nr:hypothetical protein [bacterium]
MDIQPKRRQTTEWESTKGTIHNVADATAVVLGIKKKKVKIKKTKIKDISRGLAEVAYSMGETNDPEDYADLITEDIFEAFKKIEERQAKQKKKDNRSA